MRRKYNDDDESKGMIRDNKSKEAKFSDQTGSVRKFDMDTLASHASKETPVSFPGWRGYPPDRNDAGQKVDYSMSSNGGFFSQKKLTDTQIVYSPTKRAAHGRRASTPAMMAGEQIAGNTTWQNKMKAREFQDQLRCMRPEDRPQGSRYIMARTGPQHLQFF